MSRLPFSLLVSFTTETLRILSYTEFFAFTLSQSLSLLVSFTTEIQRTLSYTEFFAFSLSQSLSPLVSKSLLPRRHREHSFTRSFSPFHSLIPNSKLPHPYPFFPIYRKEGKFFDLFFSIIYNPYFLKPKHL